MREKKREGEMRDMIGNVIEKLEKQEMNGCIWDLGSCNKGKPMYDAMQESNHLMKIGRDILHKYHMTKINL